MIEKLKNKLNNKLNISIIVLIFIFVCIIILFISASTVKEYTASKTYMYGEASKTYTIPATPAKDAIYTKQDPYDLFIGDPEIDNNNDGKSDYPYISVGTDIPAGEYKVTDLDLDSYCSFNVYKNGYNNMFDGTQYYKGDTINLNDGDVLASFNCGTNGGGLNAILTPTGEAEIITPAVKAEPEHQEIEYITKINNEYTCKTDSREVVECDTLKYYDELKNEADKNSVEIVETMTISSQNTNGKNFKTDDEAVCKKNNEDVECNDLEYENTLLKDLQTPNDNLKT